MALAITAVVTPTNDARAQAYPIDCAILLCLSGGWPASAPCARAKAEFIRRITPLPVEPPLQIWRCPMRASYGGGDPARGHAPLIEIRLGAHGQSPAEPPALLSATETQASDAQLDVRQIPSNSLPADLLLLRTGDQADIDISDPAFDFVRSIRVYHVRYARQREADKHGDCNRSASVALGTYGLQGDFSWKPSSPRALPPAHRGLHHWGKSCPTVEHRSVFVDWLDASGGYGFEQVNY
ncbi:hypothetical protein [Oceanicola sp. 502str15]|uniref:hypothetical protein n=1 Tax=Oceanicola sp. 502str15 TaxID=2696061 RepID=UPI002095D956|nr:hypothetical protein [Oceanicola sp. 502str15]